MQIINKLSDLKGRLIAYIGGGGITAYSADVTAKAKEAAETVQQSRLLTMPITSWLTVGDVLTLIGAMVVLGRFLFDVYKYFDQRRDRHAID